MPWFDPPRTARSWAGVAVLLAAYSLWVGLVVGFRGDHLFLMAFCLCCWALNGTTRRFIRAFFVFVVYWVVYDSMRICPNYTVNPVHIGDLYDLEKRLFGIATATGVLTPNEFFGLHYSPAADIAAGLFYINWVPVPLAFGIFLFMRDKVFFLRYSHAFVLTNFIGFVLYYLYPAAPPWFVSQYGTDFLSGIPANPGRLIRFDELTGIPLFQSIYAKNANIFAAMPSLHAAYPVVLLYYGIRRRLGPVNWFFAAFMVGIWWTAIYTDHHYILDVLAGACCALASVALFEWAYAQPALQNRLRRFAATF